MVLLGVANTANKYAFVGDFSANGTLPGLVTMTNNCFHLMDNVDILVAAEVGTAWMALSSEEELIPVLGVGTNVEQKRT